MSPHSQSPRIPPGEKEVCLSPFFPEENVQCLPEPRHQDVHMRCWERVGGKIQQPQLRLEGAQRQERAPLIHSLSIQSEHLLCAMTVYAALSETGKVPTLMALDGNMTPSMTKWGHATQC